MMPANTSQLDMVMLAIWAAIFLFLAYKFFQAIWLGVGRGGWGSGGGIPPPQINN